MPGNCLHQPVLRIDPKRVGGTFPLQDASVIAKVAKKRLTLQAATVTVPRTAPCGAFRRASSRRSWSTSEIAAARFSRHSSAVRPCPFASGNSGQKPTYHSPSRSIRVVNSFCIQSLTHNQHLRFYSEELHLFVFSEANWFAADVANDHASDCSRIVRGDQS